MLRSGFAGDSTAYDVVALQSDDGVCLLLLQLCIMTFLSPGESAEVDAVAACPPAAPGGADRA